MGVRSWFGKHFLEDVKISSNQTVIIEVPAALYYKELAIYTACSYLANAVSMCEMRTFIKGEQVKNEDYYLLNVSPNKNENSNYFWHRVVNKMIRDEKGALVVEINGELHCAEEFSVLQERPIRGNIYGGVMLKGGLQLNRTFQAKEVYLFKMEDECVKSLIDGMYTEYSKLLQSAARSFKDTNGRKFILKIEGVKSGDDEFNKTFNEQISKDIKTYMENEYATYVENDGEHLEEQSNNKPQKSAEDFINLRKDMFELTGHAFKIPTSMMTGNVTSLKDVCDIFLTFAVDPLANTITEVLNKRATAHEFLQGNYYKCYTGRIKHRDLFESAANVEKVIGSSLMSPDETREELELMPLNETWSRKYYVTNNFREANDVRTAVEGGENDE